MRLSSDASARPGVVAGVGGAAWAATGAPAGPLSRVSSISSRSARSQGASAFLAFSATTSPASPLASARAPGGNAVSSFADHSVCPTGAAILRAVEQRDAARADGEDVGQRTPLDAEARVVLLRLQHQERGERAEHAVPDRQMIACCFERRRGIAIVRGDRVALLDDAGDAARIQARSSSGRRRRHWPASAAGGPPTFSGTGPRAADRRRQDLLAGLDAVRPRSARPTWRRRRRW